MSAIKTDARVIVIKREPVGKMSPRLCGDRAYNPQSVEVAIVQNEIRQQWYDQELITEAVHLEFSFEFEPPKSWSRPKRTEALSGRLEKATKPDTSNLVKFYEDCLKGIVLEDDNQVTQLSAKKSYGPSDLIIIYVTKVRDAE